MTDKDRENMAEMFKRYGSPYHEASITLYLYLLRPDKLDTCDRIASYDKSAEQYIARLARQIEQLKSYRLALQERYNEIATAPTVPLVRLKREKNTWTNKVSYYLTVYKKYTETGELVKVESTTYSGTERHKAIRDFEAYKKAHPGIISELNIEKGKWEK